VSLCFPPHCDVFSQPATPSAYHAMADAFFRSVTIASGLLEAGLSHFEKMRYLGTRNKVSGGRG